MRKFYSTRGRWPMALAAVAGAVMLGAPPALAAPQGAHSGVTTFDTTNNTCPTPPPGSQNFGEELALTYEGQGVLTSPAARVVTVYFETDYVYQGPPGVYEDSTCETIGGSATVTSATISDAVGTGSCEFDGGEYTRDGGAIPPELPEKVTFTGGSCSGTLTGVSASLTNEGTSACVFGVGQSYPEACESTWTLSDS